MMTYVYVQAFISSMGIYFPLYGGHEFLTIRLEREPERGGTVDVLFLFISSRCHLRVMCSDCEKLIGTFHVCQRGIRNEY